MASNVSRGARAKGKTKQWLERRGYQVADMEIVRTVWRDGRPAFQVKRDQFGADLLALGHNTIVFVQVKSGKVAASGSFPQARREFGKYQFPEAARTLIVAWPPDARVPRVVECFKDGSWREAVVT